MLHKNEEKRILHMYLKIFLSGEIVFAIFYINIRAIQIIIISISMK